MTAICNSPSLSIGTADYTKPVMRATKDSDPSPVESANVTLPAKPKMLWQVKNRENYVPLKLYHPYDVAFLWDNRVALVEGFFPYSRIQVLDSTGKCLNNIAQGEIMPYGITTDAEGYLAITDHKDRTVKFYTPDGKFALSWRSNMFDWPDGIASTKGGHYVITDWTKGCLSVHDIDGIQLRKVTTSDPKDPKSSCPAYVTIDRWQRILITDTFDHTVKVFNNNGQFLFKFGGYSNDSTSNDIVIKDPRGITTDAQGNILVAEWGGNRVSHFSPDGRFIRYVLTNEDVKYPWGITVNKSGQILVSEQKLNSKPGLKMFQTQS